MNDKEEMLVQIKLPIGLVQKIDHLRVDELKSRKEIYTELLKLGLLAYENNGLVPA